MANLRVFTYQELCDSTNNFANVVGYGASGNVSIGKIGDQEVAVKLFKLSKDAKDTRISEFFNGELDVLKVLDHQHIVKLIGYSNDERQLLVYQLVEGPTLAQLLSGVRLPGHFNFLRRTQVLLGVADAILYLHKHKLKIVHRDINSTNILVDGFHFSPVLTGFSLPRYLFKASSHNEIDIPGYPKIKDPLSVGSKQSSITNDVYSFGVVILATLSGKLEGHRALCDWAASVPQGRHDLVADPQLQGEYSIPQMLALFSLGKNCVSATLNGRRSITRIHLDLCNIYAQTEQWENRRTGAGSSQQVEGSKKEKEDKVKGNDEDEAGRVERIEEVGQENVGIHHEEQRVAITQPKKKGKFKRMVKKFKNLFKS